jgi:hypothetical protein
MTGTRTLTRGFGDAATVGMTLVGLAALYIAGFSRAMNGSFDVWGAFVVAPILVAVSVPVLLRFARTEPHAWTARLLIAGLLLKLLAGLVRYQVAFGAYDGSADAARYDRVGTALAQQFRHMDFSLTAMDAHKVTGTGFVEIVTGVIYAVTGPTLIGGYLVFTWLGYWGLFLFYRAFRVAVPEGDAKRYGLLLFLLPSMLFWPSGIGKEAWMLLGLGAGAYGGALLLGRRRGAVPWLVAGCAATLAVRPHITLVLVAALAIAYLVRSRHAMRATALGPIRTVLGLAATVGAVVLLLRQAATFFGVDAITADSANQLLDSVQQQTAEGGSAYQGAGGPSLVNMPTNLVTVLFRPWPFEAHNAFAMISACEGTLLLLIALLSLPRLAAIRGLLRRQPYLTLCLTFVLCFCFLFSTFQNFGILTRERVQVFPFVLVLLALPIPRRPLRPGRRPAPPAPESARRSR